MQNLGVAVGIFDMITGAKIDFLNNLSYAYYSLTVAVASDDLAKIITGKQTVVDVNNRIRIIRALRCVGKVICLNSIQEIEALKDAYGNVFIYDDMQNHEHAMSAANSESVKTIFNENRYSCDKVNHLSGVIGYTTGVFDLFHIGHLNLLEKAKEKCDKLIVGVSTDELVEQYKNKKPKVNFFERAKIVESLKCVDAVVKQVSMDKYEAWEKLKYNILFHGDDWKGSSIYIETEKKLEKVGVKIIYFPYTKGVSSTILSEKMFGE